MQYIVRWLFLVALSAAGIVFGFRRGVQVGRRTARRNPYDLISHNNIEQLVIKLQSRNNAHNQLLLTIFPHHGAPDSDQWISLLQHDPATAYELIEQLYERLFLAGMQVDLATANSIEAYHAAQIVLRSTKDLISPKPKPWQSYPTEAEWKQLLQTDPNQARSKVALIEIQQARFGIGTPVEIQESLQAFHRVITSLPNN